MATEILEVRNCKYSEPYGCILQDIIMKKNFKEMNRIWV